VIGEADAGFPTTIGSFQEVNRGLNDTFIAHLDPSRSQRSSTRRAGRVPGEA
jgi:hypothetical protein